MVHAAKITGLRGRWEKVREKPFTVCDTAHNSAGWAWVRRQLEQCTYRNLHMILGFVNDKDISEILQLMPRHATYYFTKAPISRALDENELLKTATEYALKGNAYPNFSDAFHDALQQATEDDMIFIGGSTFVVAEALK